jgi:hypothetical protein
MGCKGVACINVDLGRVVGNFEHDNGRLNSTKELTRDSGRV